MKLYEDGMVLRYRVFRIQHHVTLRELSEQAGISVQRISQIELMGCCPGAQAKAKLVSAMQNALLQRGEQAAAAVRALQADGCHLFEACYESEALSDE